METKYIQMYDKKFIKFKDKKNSQLFRVELKLNKKYSFKQNVKLIKQKI